MKYLLAYTIVFILFAPFNSQAQNGQIKGVVTYFFNNHQGNKPDLGAQVYVVDSAHCTKFNPEISFQYELAVIKGISSEGFKEIDKKNALNNNELINCEGVKKATVDGAGNYSFNLPPAIYYVLIKSKGRNGLSLTDITGKAYFIKVRVSPEQSKDVSNNFTLD